MATINKAALRSRVLEHLGVIAAGQTPASADQTLVDEAIDACHAKLRKRGLAPYPTSAVVEWAQTLLRDYVAGDVAKQYGKAGQELSEFKAMAVAAELEMRKQLANDQDFEPVRAEYL